MISFLLILLLLALLFKLGFGIIKIFAFLLIVIITAAFFAYLLIPLIAIFIIGTLLWAIIF